VRHLVDVDQGWIRTKRMTHHGEQLDDDQTLCFRILVFVSTRLVLG
jgi:hypothetical protein